MTVVADSSALAVVEVQSAFWRKSRIYDITSGHAAVLCAQVSADLNRSAASVEQESLPAGPLLFIVVESAGEVITGATRAVASISKWTPV